MYKALNYKIEHDNIFSDVQINEDVWRYLLANIDTNIFNILKFIHIEFDFDMTDYVVIGPMI